MRPARDPSSFIPRAADDADDHEPGTLCAIFADMTYLRQAALSLLLLACGGGALAADAADPLAPIADPLAPPAAAAPIAPAGPPAAEPPFNPLLLRVISPDGRREFTQSRTERGEVGPMVIRELPSRRVIDRKHFTPFKQAHEVEHVSWNPNGSAFVVDAGELRGPVTAIYLITDRGLVELELPFDAYEKTAWHEREPPVTGFVFPSGGWTILEWLDNRRFRMSFHMHEILRAECEFTFRITPRHRIVTEKVVDLITGSQPSYRQWPAAWKKKYAARLR